jgi:hypothetical protein
MSVMLGLPPPVRIPRQRPAQRPPRPFSDVKMATAEDADDLIWFLRSVADEIDGGAAEDDLMTAMATQLARRDGGMALIVRGSRGIEASMGIVFLRPLLSRNYFLHTVWRVVAPEARMTGHAKSLLVEARKYADGIGRRLQNIEYAAEIDAPTIRLCTRHLKISGAVFSHIPENASPLG